MSSEKDESYIRSIPEFKSTRDTFPDFYQMFCLAAEAKGIEYVILRENDDPPVKEDGTAKSEMQEERELREAQGRM